MRCYGVYFAVMKKVVIVIGLLVFVVLIYLSGEGLFKTVNITEKQMPGYRVVGVQHRGPYENIGDAFERVHALADQHSVPVEMIGVYFDNPEKVAKDSLRSMAGLIVSVEDSAKLADIPELVPLVIPAGNAAVSSFPTDGMVSMIIGAMKSYPKLTQYAASMNRGEDVNFVYEVYGEGQTQYVMQFRD